MAAFHSRVLVCVAWLFILAMAVKASLSVDLLHRDSTQSPFYNPTETSSQRIGNAFLRSHGRARLLSAASSFVSSSERSIQLTFDSGEFLMKYSVGQPPVQMFGIVDTSSELIWMQCQPCVQCYNQTSQVFDSRNSTSYTQLACFSTQCQSFQGKSYCSSINANETCKYDVEYGDGSFSRGDIALETLTLSSSNGIPITFPNTVIGCRHENVGKAFIEKSSGVVGFGATALSLVSQFASFVDGKFSYCLAPSVESPSTLTLGPNPEASGNDLISTPLILRDHSPLYFLTLEAVSVGDNRIGYSDDPISAALEGNIVLDSGAYLTYLPAQFYSQLEAAVAQEMNLERVADPNGQLSLCYKYNDTTSTIPAPVITVHFRNANLTLSSTNTFGSVSDEVRCFVFGGTKGAISIFGSFAQFNFLVSHDIQGRTVSFKPMDCTLQ